MTEGNNIPEGETAGVDETPAGSEPAKEKRPEEEQDGEKEGTEDKESWDSKLDIPEKNDAPGAKEEVEFVHPEGGWGWVVMLASMWCNGSVFGIQNNFGVIYVYLLQEFASKDIGSEDDKDLKFRASWVGSLSMGMIFLCSPIVSIFTDMLGCRIIAVGGAAVALIGLLASSFVTSLGVLYFTYGIVFSCGCSFAYQPSLVILGHYFKKRLGLVNGIVTAGSGVFTIIMPFLLSGLLKNVGLYNTMRVLCVFMFVLLLAGFTYKPLMPVRPKDSQTGSSRMKQIFNVNIWKSWGYRIWAFGIPAALYGYYVPYVHLMKHVEERFGPDTNKEVLLMCIGITSGIGRLIFGIVADYINGVNKVFLQVASFFVIGLMSMMIPVCNVFGGLIAVCLLMGLFDGCFICIMAPIAFEVVGAKDVSQAIGFLLGLMSVPMTVGPPIAGYLRDKMGNYDTAFYLAGVPPIIGGALLCLIPWVEAKRKRREKKEALKGEQEATQKMMEHEKAQEDVQHKAGDSVL